MKISLRRQLRFLQIYAAASFAVAAFLFLSAFTQPQRRITELTVERLNVVDANGTLRFVLSNKDQPLSELIKGLNAANKLPDGPARDEAVKAVARVRSRGRAWSCWSAPTATHQSNSSTLTARSSSAFRHRDDPAC